MMKVLSVLVACIAIAGVTPYGNACSASVYGRRQPHLAEDQNAFRREFFANLRDSAYLESNNNDECYSQSASGPQICQNFKKDSENAINGQINLELYASYIYSAMSIHFARADQARLGFSKFFKKMSDEEREHAFMLMEYQVQRGGTVEFYHIRTPHKTSWSSGLEAMEDSLDMEKRVNKALLKVHQVAQNMNDPQLQDYLEGNFLKEQVESIKQFGNYVQKLRRLRSNDPGIGEHMFDKELA